MDAVCSGCGRPVTTGQEPLNPSKTGIEEEAIDLSNVENMDAPQEKRHKGMVVAALILMAGWIVFTFLCSALASTVGRGSIRDAKGILFVALPCVPVAVIGLILVSVKKKAAGPMRKLEKSYFIAFCIFCTIVSSLSVVIAFAPVLTDASLGDLARVFAFFFFISALIAFVFLGFVFAKQVGKEGVYAMLKAFFVSFLLAPVIGYLAIKMFVAVVIFIIISVVALGAIFANGGTVIYRRR